jgi:hypothetical protein
VQLQAVWRTLWVLFHTFLLVFAGVLLRLNTRVGGSAVRPVGGMRRMACLLLCCPTLMALMVLGRWGAEGFWGAGVGARGVGARVGRGWGRGWGGLGGTESERDKERARLPPPGSRAPDA